MTEAVCPSDSISHRTPDILRARQLKPVSRPEQRQRHPPTSWQGEHDDPSRDLPPKEHAEEQGWKLNDDRDRRQDMDIHLFGNLRCLRRVKR